MGQMSIEAIKDAIADLPEKEKISLAAWLSLQTMDEWDQEMRRDFSAAGPGSGIVEKVREQIQRQEFRPMSERKRRR